MFETDHKSRLRDDKSLFWSVLLSALPVAFALVSFQTDGQFAYWQLVTRRYWLVGLLFEVSTVIFAFSQGYSIWQEFSRYSGIVRLAVPTWLAALTLATLFAAEPERARVHMIFWIVHALFAGSTYFLLCQWARRRSQSVSTHLGNCIPAASAAFAFIIVAFVMIVGIREEFNWVYSLPGFSHIRHSGYFLLPAMALSTGIIATTRGRLMNFHILLLSVNWGFTIWIGSRGPLVVFLVAWLVSLMVFVAMREKRALIAIVSSILLGTILSQLLPVPPHSSFNAISRIEGSKSQSVDKLSSGRTDIWRDTAKGIAERPLFGHGGGQFRSEVPAAKNTYNHPHNSILQFVYEWGIVGGCALLLLIAVLIWRAFKQTLQYPSENLALFLALSSMAIFSLIDGVFYYNLPIMLFLTFAYCIVTSNERKPA